MMYVKAIKETIGKYYYLSWFNNTDNDAYLNKDIELPTLKRENATADLCLMV